MQISRADIRPRPPCPPARALPSRALPCLVPRRGGHVVGDVLVVYARLDHDLVVWAGDLNYSLHDTVSPFDARDELKIITSEPIETQLVAADQLLSERNARRAFSGFQEAPLRFRPTYRVLVGEDSYDPKRCPAWTDRVLWREKVARHQPSNQPSITCAAYSCCWEARLSDHKPVYALLDIDLGGLCRLPPSRSGSGRTQERQQQVNDSAGGNTSKSTL